MATDAVGAGGSEQKDAAMPAELGEVGGASFDGANQAGTGDGDCGRCETVCPSARRIRLTFEILFVGKSLLSVSAKFWRTEASRTRRGWIS